MCSCMRLHLCFQECQECLQKVLDLFLWTKAALAVTDLAASFEETCRRENKDGDAEQMCSAIASRIRGDPSTNLGRRAGILCSLIGNCGAELASDTTCVLKIRSPTQGSITGNFSFCTIEGVHTGRLPPQVVLSSGEGQLQGCVSFPLA